MKQTPTGDLYKQLGLTPSASAAEIKSAYRRLAMQYHPDRQKDGKSPDANRFKDINQAYRVLSDPNSRRRYDRQYGQQNESFNAAPWAQSGPSSRGPSTRNNSSSARQSSSRRSTNSQSNRAGSANSYTRQGYSQTSSGQTDSSTKNSHKKRDSQHAYTQRKASQAYESWNESGSPKRSKDIEEALLWYRLWLKAQRERVKQRREHVKPEPKQAERQTEQAGAPPETEIANYQCQRCGTRYHLLQQRRFFKLRQGKLQKDEGFYCQLCSNILHFKATWSSMLWHSWQHWKGPVLAIKAAWQNAIQPEQEQNAYLAYQFAGQRTKLGYTKQAREAFLLAHRLSKDNYFQHLIEDSMQRQFNWSARYLRWRSYRKKLLILSVLFIALISWLLVHESSFSGRPATPTIPVVTPSKPDAVQPNEWTVPSGHIPLPYRYREGNNYLLISTPVYQAEHQDSPVIAELPPFSDITAVKQARNAEWLFIEAHAKGQVILGFVPEHRVGFGDAAYAAQHQCQAYPPPLPTHGSQIKGQLLGKTGEIRLLPSFSSPAAISFYTLQDQLAHKIYLSGDLQVTPSRLVTGTYKVKVDTGELYNSACNIFMRNAQGYWLPERIVIKEQTINLLTIPTFIGQPL
jgi:curved DNA-binding protein CbpA